MSYKKSIGTYDLYGTNSLIWQDIINKMIKVCELYNFKYIRTPIFESTVMYSNLIGENTDIVSKELYTFKDKKNNNISLRPEGTTGVLRSYLENKLYLEERISKFYYYGSMFRQEKIENGRFREFQQFGVEVFNDNSIYADISLIILALDIFKSLGLEDVTVYINNLGSFENKMNYENTLKEYFKPYLSDLCDDCKKRYKKNPIRILDCKIDKKKDYIVNAPKIVDFIDENSKNRFKSILTILKKLKIKYKLNKNLVRGINYYTDTVFEIKTSIKGLGSANTICGGGRYNSIVLKESGKSIPAIGFAIGIERLINILKEKDLINLKNKIIDFNFKFIDLNLIREFRKNNYVCESGSLNDSKYIIEKDKDYYILKDMNNNIIKLSLEELKNKFNIN